MTSVHVAHGAAKLKSGIVGIKVSIMPSKDLLNTLSLKEASPETQVQQPVEEKKSGIDEEKNAGKEQEKKEHSQPVKKSEVAAS